jgi:hypothetical protein
MGDKRAHVYGGWGSGRVSISTSVHRTLCNCMSGGRGGWVSGLAGTVPRNLALSLAVSALHNSPSLCRELLPELKCRRGGSRLRSWYIPDRRHVINLDTFRNSAVNQGDTKLHNTSLDLPHWLFLALANYCCLISFCSHRLFLSLSENHLQSRLRLSYPWQVV